MIRFVLAIFLCLWSLPGSAVTINCVTSAAIDTPAIQAALNAGGEVETTGYCQLNATLEFNTNGTTLRPGGHYYSTATLFKFNATQVSVVCKSKAPILNAAGGHFLLVTTANTFEVSGCRGKSLYSAFWMNAGAGATITNNHFNGTPGTGAYAILAQSWDTAFIQGNLYEEFDNFIRLGFTAPAQVFDFHLVNNVVDRLNATNGVCLHIEGATGGSVANVQSANLWCLGMKYPGIFARASRVQLVNSQFINSGTPNYIFGGSTASIQTLNDIFN